MNFTRRGLLRTAAALPLASALSPVLAQNKFPSGPAKLIVPFAPGGAADLLGRVMAEKMARPFGQPIIVENKSGAGAALGTRAAAHAAPDGLTALLHGSTMLVQQILNKEAGYDFRRDFTPVTLLTQFPLVLVVHPSLPVKNINEFPQYARVNQSKFFFGSAGTGSSQHLVGELFNRALGIKMQHVPYRGNGPATTALLAGDIQVFFDIIPTALSYGAIGKVRNLAVTSKKRNATLPDIPSLNETILPGFEANFWHGLHLPKGTNASVVDHWYKSAKVALTDKDLQKKFSDLGFETIGSTPQELAAYMEQDSDKWGKVIADANIKI